MQLFFSEAKTRGILKVGNEELLQKKQLVSKIEFYTFIISNSSSAELIVDNTPITLPPKHIISISPNQLFAFKQGTDLRVYQFNREFYCIKDHDKEVSCMGVLFYSYKNLNIISLDSNEVEKLSLIHSSVIEELENNDEIQAEMLRVLLKNIIIRVTRLVNKKYRAGIHVSSPKQDLLRQFNILVEEYFRTEHQVSFYADKLFKSPKTLSNTFKEQDTSPLKIIHNRIVLEAKRLLLYSEKPLKEIALDLGFSDTSNFSRLFKKIEGLSPIELKKGKIDLE